MAKMNPYGMITNGDKKPAKKIKRMTHHMSHDGKIIHTHEHHNPEHHPDETHVSNNMDEMQAHMSENMPNMSAAPPAMAGNDAEGGAAPAAAPPA